MKIANNRIKEHLKNVYFLCGGAYGGKTTMAKEILGFVYVDYINIIRRDT